VHRECRDGPVPAQEGDHATAGNRPDSIVRNINWSSILLNNVQDTNNFMSQFIIIFSFGVKKKEIADHQKVLAQEKEQKTAL
jgi:hypothetical protein